MLKTFQYEIFLSYGWAGNDDTHTGARQWAARLRDRLVDRLGANLFKPRIFFDGSAARVGPIPDFLYPAIEQSALFLFLVSPGSCQPASWCQKEATHFRDHARPIGGSSEIVPHEHRIFKVKQAGVRDDRSVDPLARSQLTTFDLCDMVATTTGAIEQAGDLVNPSPRVAEALSALAASLRNALERISRLEGTRTFDTAVFLGPTFSTASDIRFIRLRRELMQRGHTVCSATPLPPEAETEDEHSVRVDAELSVSQSAIHLIPSQLQSNGWQHSTAAIQLRKSIRHSRCDPGFTTSVWFDPDQESADAECVKELAGSLPENVRVWKSVPFETMVDGVIRGMNPETNRPPQSHLREEYSAMDSPGVLAAAPDFFAGEQLDVLLSRLAALTVKSGKVSQAAGRRALCYQIGVDPNEVDLEGIAANFAETLTHWLYETGNIDAIIRLCRALETVLRGRLLEELIEIRGGFARPEKRRKGIAGS